MLLGRQRFKTLTAQDVAQLAAKQQTSIGSKLQIQSNFGIEHASTLFVFFGTIIGLLYDVFNGHKVRAFNQITKAISAFIKARTLFKESGIIWDEMRDLEEPEREDLSKLLLDSLDLELDMDDPKTAETVANAVRGIIDLTKLAASAKTA